MKFTHFILFTIITAVFTSAQSQTYRVQENPWILGIAVNTINDSGNGLNGLFDFEDNYHYSIPFRISIEKRFADDYGFEVSGTFNQFLEGKIVNGSVLEDDVNFTAIDAAVKYYFTNNFLNKYRALYEAYITAGAGSSFYDSEAVGNALFGVGLNYYISEFVRLNGQVTAKISVSDNALGSNYLQYHLGLIFRLEDDYFE